MMTKSIKNLLIACSVFCGTAVALTACEDMFETDSDRQIFDPELDQKTDSMFYTLGILKGLFISEPPYFLTFARRRRRRMLDWTTQ